MILETDAPKQSGKGLIRSQKPQMSKNAFAESSDEKNNGQNYIVSVTHLL